MKREILNEALLQSIRSQKNWDGKKEYLSDFLYCGNMEVNFKELANQVVKILQDGENEERSEVLIKFLEYALDEDEQRVLMKEINIHEDVLNKLKKIPFGSFVASALGLRT